MLEKILTILIGYLDIIPAILSFAILVLLTIIVSNIIAKITKFLMPKNIDPVFKSFVPKLTKYVVLIFGLALDLSMAGMNVTSITAMFGMSSLAIGMALKDLFTNGIQGFMILIHHPFNIGDEITIGSATGKVIKISLMYTKLDCNGEFKLIPNNKVFSEIIAIKK